MFIRESEIVIGIMLIIFIGFGLIFFFIAYLLGVNKIINQYKGIEPEYLYYGSGGYKLKHKFLKGDIKTTTFVIIFITLICGFWFREMWLSIRNIISVVW